MTGREFKEFKRANRTSPSRPQNAPRLRQGGVRAVHQRKSQAPTNVSQKPKTPRFAPLKANHRRPRLPSPQSLRITMIAVPSPAN